MIVAFKYPQYLYFLFLVPLVIFFHFASLRFRKSRALKFANFEAIARIKGVDVLSKNFSILIISIIIISCLTFSLSGLTVQREMAAVRISFVIAIDSSGSMEANDLKPTRIEAAKANALEFVKSTPPGTRMGVLSFSGNSLVEQDVTDSSDAVSAAIRSIDLSNIGGTDLYDAVITSVNLLRGEKSGAIIILSDGQMNVGDLDEAIDYANKYSIAVHTIAIGTADGGETSFGVSKLEEDYLKALSYNTGGIYSNVNSGDDLKLAFDKIKNAKLGNVSINLSAYMIIVAIILFLVEYIFINSSYKIFS